VIAFICRSSWVMTGNNRKVSERRKAQRARMALPCTLSRTTSSPIWAETIDVGEGGMSVRATRPLREDETIEFAIEDADVRGRARVLRHNSPRVYGLRFEGLQDHMRARLMDLVHTGV
jgi:PilZ domain-containing protein